MTKQWPDDDAMVDLSDIIDPIMSTEYENLANIKLTAYEHSAVIDLYVAVFEDDDVTEHFVGRDLNVSQLCALAEELIKVASYISEDPQNTLETYNVDYNKSNAVGIH